MSNIFQSFSAEIVEYFPKILIKEEPGQFRKVKKISVYEDICEFKGHCHLYGFLVYFKSQSPLEKRVTILSPQLNSQPSCSMKMLAVMQLHLQAPLVRVFPSAE